MPVVAWRGVGVELSGDADLLEPLQQQVPDFFDGTGAVVAAAHLRRGRDEVLVELPGGLSVTGPYGDEVFRAAASRIELLIAAALPDRVAVHAGVVAWNDTAILLPGVSQIGKSTLVGALLQAGATYLSDEFALLDGDGTVWPYPRRMTTRTATGTRRSTPECSADPDGPPLPVGLVAHLQFSGDWRVEDRSWGQRVMALAANTLPIRPDPARSLNALSAASRDALGLEGTRGEATDAARHLLALL